MDTLETASVNFYGYEKFNLAGGSAFDKLYGGNNNDILTGNAGNDSLVGYGGVDNIVGGLGNDCWQRFPI